MNVKEESSSVEESQVAGTSSSVVDEKGGKSPEMDKEKKDSAVKLSGDKETERKVIEKGTLGRKICHRTPEEEDLGWDEIEDLSSIDEKKVTHVGSGSSNKADLRKRLSTAEEEEEDLSWDIEDEDDEPAKP
ncbi:BSD domain-containing protein 1 [Prunus yedoensis var. nudiflora]|uniref:BSD domain-containing protein 1 n=1 Tax=Prunus yedoensis var. nudiflora TaxID=2094558 RepID=A0A314UC00_PRUYE|nr:BSD domain-containing protein 1 [Prunus yedoensis var. nudiflora]